MANCLPLVTANPSIRHPGQPGYPAALAQALGARAMPLTVLGQLEEARWSVAIVGARRASVAGLQAAEQLAAELARRGAMVVSGGAYGVDAAAHRGALAAGGKTVAVLGTGIDVVYPERHRPLFDQIVAQGGALVSMFADGTPPRAGNFVARNALVSGLGQAVVVVEAEPRSGSLITARWARKQGRVVCAQPGSAGTAWLLGQGAIPVRGAQDVLAAIAGELTPSARAVPEGDAARVLAAVPTRGGLDEETLAEALGLSARAVVRALCSLELLGLVMAAPGRRYLRTASPSAPIARGSCGQYPN